MPKESGLGTRVYGQHFPGHARVRNESDGIYGARRRYPVVSTIMEKLAYGWKVFAVAAMVSITGSYIYIYIGWRRIDGH